MKPKVYVPQFVRNSDYSNLEKYGEVVFLTHKEYPRDPCPEPERWEVGREITRGLETFRPKVDYLALSASPIPNFIAGAFMRQMAAKMSGRCPIQILKYNNMKMDYDRFTVEI